MDTALLLVLPLVGGYIFASRWTVTQYIVDREDGHRLYFRAAFYGAFLFTVAILVRMILISYIDSYQSFEQSAVELYKGALKNPDEENQLRALTIGLLALVIGSFLWVPFLWLPQSWLRYLYNRAIKYDEFESLISEAAQRVVPVSITMQNNKVYVGFLNETPSPKQRRFLAVLPLMSGFRDEANGRVKFTTYYSHIYRKQRHADIEDFRFALPMEKIQSLNMFDVAVYEEFQKQESQLAKKKMRQMNPRTGKS